MRELADKERIEASLRALGKEATSDTVVYLVGGTSAVLTGWRATTFGGSHKSPTANPIFPVMNRPRMTVRVVPLADAEAGDSRMGATADERVAAVTALTLEVWRLYGRSLPTYTRATTPVVVGSRRCRRDRLRGRPRALFTAPIGEVGSASGPGRSPRTGVLYRSSPP